MPRRGPGAWAPALLAALPALFVAALVARYGLDVPLLDDWDPLLAPDHPPEPIAERADTLERLRLSVFRERRERRLPVFGERSAP